MDKESSSDEELVILLPGGLGFIEIELADDSASVVFFSDFVDFDIVSILSLSGRVVDHPLEGHDYLLPPPDIKRFFHSTAATGSGP